ncbi:MAG: FumA C-terminus/TtdB family hydratase beta subunit, partial [Acidimicrobiales bacterium]
FLGVHGAEGPPRDLRRRRLRGRAARGVPTGVRLHGSAVLDAPGWARPQEGAALDAADAGQSHPRPARVQATPAPERLASADLPPAVVGGPPAQPMDSLRAQLSRHPVKTRLSLTGTLVVGRDIAHARIKERLDAGESMPRYLRDHAIYYAGPAKTPEGYASGSFGPTTAGRMDSYVEQFQAAGGSLVMLAKGNRSEQVTEACAAHGGFYLGSIGGPAARLAKDSIRRVEVLEHPELGMEAIWRIEVEHFPAFIVIDDKGNDFYAEVSTPVKLRR